MDRCEQQIWQQILALSCPWASYNKPRQLQGSALWLRRIRPDSNSNEEFHWLTGRLVGELEMRQNNVTLSAEVIFWAAPSHNTTVGFTAPGLVLLKQTVTQAEIVLSFHNFFETLEFHYHLWFDVFWHTSLFFCSSGNTLRNMSNEHLEYLMHLL